jgi:hypothetical protein
MRRTRWIAVTLLVLLAGVAIAVGAYNAGVSHGLAQAASGTEVVRVVGPGYGYGGGFFPFGLFLFPLFFFLIFGLVRGAFWGRRWGGPGRGGHDGPGHPHGGPERWRDGAEEWHRRQHDPSSGDRGSGEAPAVA